MNILFVNNFYNLFENADSGASQRSMCLIRALAKIGHVDVISFMDDTVSNVSNVDVIYSHKIDKEEHKVNRLDKFLKLFYWHRPYLMYPINKQKSSIIDYYVNQKKYDYIVTRYIQFACDCGLLKYRDRLVLDIDDDPIDVVLMTMDKVKTLRNRLYTRIFANTMTILARYITSRVKVAFYSTPAKHYPNAAFLPNISAYNTPLQPADFSQSAHNILMVGTYGYLPNAEGLDHFIRNIFPIVKSIIPDAVLYVVGMVRNVDLYQLCSQTGGVKMMGFVKDLQAVYADCQCSIVPLFRGSGTSVKMIEAMSLGRPVVTTSSGARGICSQFFPNVDYILADDDAEFADGIIRLLLNMNLNHKMAKSAQEKVQKFYSVDSFNSIVNQYVSKLD